MEYLPSAVCALLLILIMVGFVFSPSLRKDLVMSEGEASLFGGISVKGVLIVLLVALLLGGMIYAYPPPPEPPSPDPPELEVLRNRVRELERALEGAESPDNITRIVRSLDPADVLSEQLRGIHQNERGPWSPFSSSTPILLSVPGANAEDRTYQRIVYGCDPYYQKKVQVISNSENSRGRTVEVTVTGAINHATDCAEQAGVNLQLDCNSATELLSSQVLTCDENGNPLWSESMRGQTKRFPAAIVILER